MRTSKNKLRVRERIGGRPKAVMLPVYQSIADTLEQELARGNPPPGAKLPSEAELAYRFDAGRHTIREALRVLREKGLIQSTPGRGSVVIADRPRRSYSQRVANLSELLRYPEGVRRHHLKTENIEIQSDDADLLGLVPRSTWVKVSGVRELASTGEAICWFDIYLAPAFAALAERGDIETITLHEEIERGFGVRIERAEVDMLVTRISAEIAGHLQCEVDAPALTTVRRYYASTGDIVQASIAVHPEKRYAYAMEFVRSS